MSRSHTVVRGALLLGAAGAMVACNSDTHLVIPTAANPIFQSYVALGNSITSGYQSGGINDSTQRLAYPVLLAKAMGTRFAYPSLVMPGCAPPVSNFLTQARVTPTGFPTSTSTTCYLRNPSSITAIINNVAVPGITSADPLAPVGPNGNTLTELFLGGETQVQKALDAKPTFATIWVGNNDVLVPATSGFPTLATPVPTFVANYKKMVEAFVAGAPGVKGVLIGVVQVAQVPILFQAGALANLAVAGAAAQVAGRPVALDPTTCAGAGAASLINFVYLANIKARPAGNPGTVFCSKIGSGGPTDLGDANVLDVAEQAAVAATVDGYNAYIRAKADTIGFAYYDPNPSFVAIKAIPGAVPAFPNLASTTQTFGQYFSLDGFHPAAAAHIVIANDLIKVINAKYSTSLVPIPTS